MNSNNNQLTEETTRNTGIAAMAEGILFGIAMLFLVGLVCVNVFTPIDSHNQSTLYLVVSVFTLLALWKL